jgi:AcrR family transcriptional regulator
MQYRASQMRNEILLAAAQMFDERGYSGTRLQDVLASSGISKGALYFHFPSKSALAVAVADESCDRWGDLLRDLRISFPRALGRLIALSWRLDRLFRQDVLLRAGMRLSLERNMISPEVPIVFESWGKEVKALLAEARDQGDLAPDVDIDWLSGFLVATASGLQHISTAPVEWTDTGRIVSAMWQLMLPGLTRQNSSLNVEEFIPPAVDDAG